jgi:hypothetical protein
MVRKSKLKKKKTAPRLAKRFAEVQAQGELVIDAGIKKNSNEVGSSGTDIIGGFIREEHLQALQGTQGAVEYDKMRRREAVVSMLLDSIKNPVKGANWSFEVEDETDETQLKMKQLCEWNLFKRGLQDGWDEFLGEVLTFIDFGYSVFEAVHATDNIPELAELPKVEEVEDPFAEEDSEEEPLDPAAELADPAIEPEKPEVEEEIEAPIDSKGPLTTYIQKMGFRKQTSIYRWNLDRKTGKIISITQQTMGDTSKQTLVDIPGPFCVVFTNKKEGDNFEGVSALRPMYGAYLRKDLYLRLTAIGAEKNAVGTVIGTAPAGKANPEQQARFEAVCEAYSGNESAYIVKPTGWEIEIKYGEFDPEKMTKLLNFEDEQMAKTVVASFLALGTGGNSGSLAVGGTLSNFFLNGIQGYAQIVANKINRDVIPSLCQMNYGPQKCYPVLKCTGINDKAGKELADIVVALTGSKIITADSKLEDFLRQQYKLPKADPETARKQPAPINPLDPNAQPSDDVNGDSKDGKKSAVVDPKPSADKKKDKASLAEKKAIHLADYKKQFDKNKEATREAMQLHLNKMAVDLVKRLRKKYDDATDAQKVNATKDMEVKASLLNEYKQELREIMALVSNEAIAQARKEVPNAAAKVKFGAYDKLNPLVKRAIERQLGLIADTQAADLQKITLFQWQSSASSTDNADQIEHDVLERLQGPLTGATNQGMSIDAAAGDAVAHVTQNSRNEFFFAPDVLETLESFTFTNEDPVSEICQNLNGQTFSVSDPAAEQFYPPLHHNCKSRVVPNGKGEGPEITGINIVADNTEERLRLEKQITLCDCSGHKLFS